MRNKALAFLFLISPEGFYSEAFQKKLANANVEYANEVDECNPERFRILMAG